MENFKPPSRKFDFVACVRETLENNQREGAVRKSTSFPLSDDERELVVGRNKSKESYGLLPLHALFLLTFTSTCISRAFVARRFSASEPFSLRHRN